MKKILVVDDYPPFIRLISMLIMQESSSVTGVTEVLTASTEAEALRALSDRPDIDVVFLDGTLIGSGPWDTQTILAEALQKGKVVIAISSMHNNLMVTHGAHTGWEKSSLVDHIHDGKLLSLEIPQTA